MQYKCQICHDTGNKEKDMGGHLTCIACEAPAERIALEAFIESLPAMGEQEQAWHIHQRALAMAPKQECFSCDGSGKSEDAAPAVANGALPELPPLPPLPIADVEGGYYDAESGFTIKKMQAYAFAYGKACHALGRGAAVREYVENGTFKPPATANGALTDADILTIIWKYSSFISVGNYSSTQFDCQADTLNCIRAILAAAGPDAALPDFCFEDDTDFMHRLGLLMNTNWPEMRKDGLARKISELANAHIRAALSGAKGN